MTCLDPDHRCWHLPQSRCFRHSLHGPTGCRQQRRCSNPRRPATAACAASWSIMRPAPCSSTSAIAGCTAQPTKASSWEPTAETLVKGRTEWPGCLLLDPTGKSKRLVSAFVYGAPIGVSADAGKTWQSMNARSSHIDWCAVDWSAPDLSFVLALKHESGELLIVSRDGGKTFTEVGKGFGPAWVFDGKTAVVAETKTKDRPRPRLLRTEDAARSFRPCGDYSTKALPKWRRNTLYWVVDGALIASTDKAKSWRSLGPLKDGRYGPIFGKDDSQMFVLTGAGLIESTDGGASWSKPLELPKELKGGGALTWIEYDPTHDILYAMNMNSQLYKHVRK